MEMRGKKQITDSESGRTMIEILMVIGIMGILSLSIAYGYIIAQRRQAAGELANLVTKSAAGVITSHELERLAEAYQGQIGEEIEIGEVLPLSMYISNVAAVEEGSEEAKLYGLEAFQAPMGTVISAYAMKNGRGLVVKLNQFATEICEDVLRIGIAYEGVWDFNDKPGVIYTREQLEESPELIKGICQGIGRNEAGLENVLDIGLIFENTGLKGMVGSEADCNEKCAVSILGTCGLTERPLCEEAACERKYYDIGNCSWKCYDGQGDGCECINSVWSTTDKQCVSCLSDADCFTRDDTKPVCENPGTDSQCQPCPAETLYNKTTEQCEDCVTLTGGTRPFFQETETGGVCVECFIDTDCPSERPICDEKESCQVCPKGSYIEKDQCKPCPTGYTNEAANQTSCPICAAGYVAAEGKAEVCCPAGKPIWDSKNEQCVQCLSSSDCKDASKPMCNVSSGVCQACPADKPIWLNGVCVQCLTNADCRDTTPICDVNQHLCQACGGQDKPYWDGQKCVECLTDDHCPTQEDGYTFCKESTHTCEICPDRIDISFVRTGTYDCSNKDYNIVQGKTYGPYECDYNIHVDGWASGNGSGQMYFSSNSGVVTVRSPVASTDPGYSHNTLCKGTYDGGVYYQLPAGKKINNINIPNAGQKCHKWCCCSRNHLTMWMERVD